MQFTIDYFESLPRIYRSLLLVTGLVAFWLIEGAIPLISLNYRRVHHAAVNLTLTFFQLLVVVTFGALVVTASRYTTEHGWGLLQITNLPAVFQIVGGVLLLDVFGGFLIHFLQHRFPWLWRFHIIHHTDTRVDVTTGLRHHPVETLFRLSAQLAAALIGGIPIGVVFMYQILSVFFAQLTHANFRPPPRMDRLFSWVFVSPNMHKVHHHFEKPLTDTNFGNVFSIWDRLFGTFAEVAPEQLQYGIDSLPSRSDPDRLSNMLLDPFRRFRAQDDSSKNGDSPGLPSSEET